MDGVLGSASSSVRAGADGKYSIEGLDRGEYEIEAFLENGAATYARCEIAAAGARVDLDLTVPAGGVTVKGKARLADGKPFRGFIALCPFRPIDEYFNLSWSREGVPVATDATGSFVIRDVPEGQVLLVAVAPPTFACMSGILTLPLVDDVILDIGVNARSVTGRVIRAEDGKPIPDAIVVVDSGSLGMGSSWSQTTSGEDGSFRVLAPGASAPSARISASARAAGRGSAQSTADGSTPEDLTLRLPRLASITGRVTDSDGKAAPGARVVAWVESDRGHDWSPGPTSVRTDDGGRFAVVGLQPGLASVLVSGGGWVSRGLALDVEEPLSPYATLATFTGAVVSDRVAVRTGSVRVHVTDAVGASVVGALVRARERLEHARPRRVLSFIDPQSVTSTSADGVSTLEGLVPDGLYQVVVQAAGHSIWEGVPFRVEVGEARALEVRLPVVRRLTVRVRAKTDGRSLQGARVTLSGSASSRQVKSVWTGADGTASITPLPSGDVSLQVDAIGWQSLASVPAVAAGTGNADLIAEALLEPGLVLAGRTTFPPGMPAGANFHVWLASRNYSSLSVLGSDGRFRMTGLAPGQYSIRVQGEYEGRSFEAIEELEAGREDAIVKLVELDPGDAAHGAGVKAVSWHARVVDANDRPVAHATARVNVDSLDAPGSHVTEVRDGVVSIEVRGSFERITANIFAARDGEGLPLAAGAITAGPFTRTDKDVVIHLPPEMFLTGQVIGADGAGVVGARVFALPGAQAESSYPQVTAHGWAITEAGGKFRVGGLTKGPYTLATTPPNEFSKPDAIDASSGSPDVVIRLQPARRVALRIADAGGKSVVGARVSVSGTEFLGRSALSDDRGLAPITGLDAGKKYTVSIHPPDGRDDVAGITRRGWEPHDDLFVLSPLLTIEGVVQDKAGKPIPDAYVDVDPVYERTPESDVRLPSFSQSLRTDAQGRFRIARLPSGSAVDLVAGMEDRPKFNERGSEVLRAKAGAKDVRITLDPGVSLLLRFEGFEGALGEMRPVITEMPDGPRHFGVLGDEFRVRFVGLTAGRTYAVWLGPSVDGRFGYLPSLVPGGAEVIVPSQVGKPITGRVNLWDGSVPDRFFVRVEMEGIFAQAWGSSSEGGRFRIPGLPEGRWKVIVSWPSLMNDALTVEAAAGADLELRIPKAGAR